jgi:hypothetical protein
MKEKYENRRMRHHPRPGCLPCADNSVSKINPSSFKGRGACLEGRNSTTELLPLEQPSF